MAEAAERYRAGGVHIRPRTGNEFARFFTGLDLLPPGIVPTNRRRPYIDPPKSQDAQVGSWAAVARKTSRPRRSSTRRGVGDGSVFRPCRGTCGTDTVMRSRHRTANSDDAEREVSVG